ncbi:ferrous iron transport protein B [Eggerthellaceae bacterium zg-887]|uniref:ferrous iron transport protein B n=1 Tax=Xiamenia xianingshaonis TaxID=2682776 RepID=UPI00140B8C3F|nr:ferrous iron transport protein B [Xiamenia xianingshaonis]NHM16729.1 ferrous iron transport protein B [Xiamenia xianingshaonis]
MTTTLDKLPIGKAATVAAVGGEGSLRQHLLDMGMIPQATVAMVKHAPLGDPIEVRVRNYELTLRLADAERIVVEDVRNAELACPVAPGADRDLAFEPDDPLYARARAAEHPGLGERGKFHDRATEHPLPRDAELTFALVGNQNCGKTTLFNALTGANQHVGNFPGVTVDRKDGRIKDRPQTLVTDLPGIYSMSPYSSEEVVTREFLLGAPDGVDYSAEPGAEAPYDVSRRPRGIINIVDATNIERNLYLTMQLLELGIPTVLALNMMDEVEGNGGTIEVNRMEALLGIPVVPLVAAKNEGTAELVDHALHVARFQEPPSVQDFCPSDEHGGAVHRCLHGIMHLIEDHAERAGIPLRFAAAKLAEGDPMVLRRLQLDDNEKDALEHIVAQMEVERGLDRAAAIADMRFSFIERVCEQCVIKPQESREHARSVRIDRILTGPVTAIPAFVAIMAAVFWLTFNVIGAFLSDWLEAGISALTDIVSDAMAAAQVNDVLQSLVIDGVFNGVGSVLSFLPIIVTLFFFLSLLEDTGYMARIAFVMDKLLRRVGLSGRSIVPMLVGFGCTVPAVMASRTLPSERDRKMTILLTPFMSCSAKLPIYGFFAAAFFPTMAAAIMVGLYFGGILIGVLVALLLRRTLFSGEAVPFVMELPNYRFPSWRNVGQLLWEKAKDFLERAFTVIFVATIVIWFLQTFDFGMNVVADGEGSMLAVIAGWVSPVFAPLGFADWRVTSALVTGVMAKESVVSTLSILFGSTEAIAASLSALTALTFLVFCLLYTPCVAALAAVRRELGGAWALAVAGGALAVAWIAALCVRVVVGACLAVGLGAPAIAAVIVGIFVVVFAVVRLVGAKRARKEA